MEALADASDVRSLFAGGASVAEAEAEAVVPSLSDFLFFLESLDFGIAKAY